MKKIITIVTFILLSTFSIAQVGIGTTTPDASAKLEIKASGTAVGLLLPRLTAAQRDASLKTPTAGLVFYNSTINSFFVATSYPYWANILNGTTWSVPTGTSTSTGQIGIGTTSPDANAILDVSSTTKGVLLPKAATDFTGVAGMMYYNTTFDGVKLYNGTSWIYLTNSLTSNGTAVVSAYTCATATEGTLIAGTTVSGVTQTITATVTTAGTYFISTTANGVTFAASGTFAGTGAQNIILTATGTPTAATASPYTYTLNTTPNCSFTRSVTDPSSNGTAVVSGYTCATATAGTLIAGTVVSGVTQTITATVTSVGTYSISTTANGVTFAASGTFAGTGAQNIILTATGTPTAATASPYTYTLNTTPNCSFTRSVTDPSSNGTAVVSAYTCATATAGTLIAGTVVSGVTQTITATVTSVGTYSISTTANGVTFAANGTFAGTGAQNIILTATGTPTAATASPYTYTLNTTPNCSFTRSVTDPSSNGTAVVSAYTCATATAGTLIKGTTVSGVTQTITATVTTVGTYSISTTANGVTFAANGTFAGTGAQNIILTATGTPTAATASPYTYTLNTTPNCSFTRSVTDPTSNGTAVVSAYTCATATAGTLIAGTVVLGVTQTITATVTSVGTYSISTTANGVTFAANGTFAGTGAQNIILTATGTPTAATASPYTYTLNTTPNCSFTRSVITVPGAPTIGTVTPGNGSTTVAFTAPTSNGGSIILDYTAYATSGSTVISGVLTQAGSGTITISGLTNGITYTYTVKARNAAGQGTASGSSTPTAFNLMVAGGTYQGGIIINVTSTMPQTGTVISFGGVSGTNTINCNSNQLNYANALAACSASTFNGYTWRLPTITELQYFYNNRAAVQTTLGGSCLIANDNYWSSTWNSNNGGGYESIQFSSGVTSVQNSGGSLRVWAVHNF